MSEENRAVILVLGSGRLSSRVADQLNKSFGQNYEICRISSSRFQENEETAMQESGLAHAKEVLTLEGHIGSRTRAVVLADVHDDINLHLLVAVLKVQKDIPIIAPFFQPALVEHLRTKYRNLHVINPAEIVSQSLSDMIITTTTKVKRNWFVKMPKIARNEGQIGRMPWLILGFIMIYMAGTAFFCLTQESSVLESAYYMLTIVTSVSFNDVELAHKSESIRLGIMILMALTYFYLLYSLAIIIDELDRSRMESAVFGRRRYHLRNHVIICGLGRVGYGLVEQLNKRGLKVLVFEKNEDCKFLRQLKHRGVPYFIGDASLPENLLDANVGQARALIAAVNDDFTNLEIALSARSIASNIRVGVRIFDHDVAAEIKEKFNIHHAFSKSSLAANVVTRKLSRILQSQTL